MINMLPEHQCLHAATVLVSLVSNSLSVLPLQETD